jgi:hypothetical protein
MLRWFITHSVFFLQVLELLPRDTLETQMGEIIPGLLKVSCSFAIKGAACLGIQQEGCFVKYQWGIVSLTV